MRMNEQSVEREEGRNDKVMNKQLDERGDPIQTQPVKSAFGQTVQTNEFK